MAYAARKISILILTLLLILSFSSCGTTAYTKSGISFEIPSRFEPRAVVGAEFAYGDDESFIVFNKRTKNELMANGLSVLDVAEFTDRFLTSSGMKDSVELVYGTDRVEFSYVVVDPENENLYYYYQTLVLKGSDCIWIVQMACYEVLASEYIPEFEKWAASIVVE